MKSNVRFFYKLNGPRCQRPHDALLRRLGSVHPASKPSVRSKAGADFLKLMGEGLPSGMLHLLAVECRFPDQLSDSPSKEDQTTSHPKAFLVSWAIGG